MLQRTGATEEDDESEGEDSEEVAKVRRGNKSAAKSAEVRRGNKRGRDPEEGEDSESLPRIE